MTLITFREAMQQSDFVVTAEPPLEAATSAADVREHAETLAPVVDALHVGDDRLACGHMSALAAARIVLDCGVDAVIRLSCRDRNRIALQADILGAAALGITSMVLVRGEKLSDNAPTRGKGVFELGGTRLIQLARRLGAESGPIADPGLYLGSFVTAFRPAQDWQATLIQQKVEAGARFLQTQPCLNMNVVGAYMQKLIEQKVPQRASIIVEVPLLGSAEDAERVKALHKGAPIPADIVRRIAEAADPVAEGIAICADAVAALREMPGVSGVNVQYSGDPGNVVAVLVQATS